MNRYIKADALKYYGNHIGDEYEDYFHETQWVYRSQIDNAPSIDIIRCSECIFDTEYYFKNDIQEHRYEWCYEFCDVDGYCPFGKKRSEREGE